MPSFVRQYTPVMTSSVRCDDGLQSLHIDTPVFIANCSAPSRFSSNISAADRMHIGCAGWALPRDQQENFPSAGTHLARYADRFTATEINSSFYRSHKAATYARWAGSVPALFRFSVKIPKTITHEHQLVGATTLLESFLAEISHLQEKLGCLLVQLPPRLAFDSTIVATFFSDLRQRFHGAVALEPRHESWFSESANALLVEYTVSRVVADPVLVPGGENAGGAAQTVYIRLHGSPRTYYSAYSDERLQRVAETMRIEEARGAAVWCIFDNTASGAAMPNALRLLELIKRDGMDGEAGAHG